MTTLDIAAVGGATPRTRRGATGDAWLAPAGILASVALWWLATDVVFAGRPLVSQFSPRLAVGGLVDLARSGVLLDAASASLFRLVAGLLIAAVAGLAIGLASGWSSRIDRATRAVQLFLRMISPLSWAPVAIIAFGVGTPPVVALVAAAAVWPIASAAADGVRGVHPGHLRVARSLGATTPEVIRRVVLPAIRPRVLAGVRLAIGIGWVVLVPAEMLGVTSGLGYQILNAKDQLAYPHITALIVVIGTIGFAIDVTARWLFATRRQRRDEGVRP